MPKRAGAYCRYPGCMELAVTGSKYCADHKQKRIIERPSAAKRGYGWTWRKIRGKILRDAGIPRELWSLWDVDHVPAYDPTVEPDHMKYQLIPRLHGDHSRKTIKEDGGFGNEKKVRGGG